MHRHLKSRLSSDRRLSQIHTKRLSGGAKTPKALLGTPKRRRVYRSQTIALIRKKPIFDGKEVIPISNIQNSFSTEKKEELSSSFDSFDYHTLIEKVWMLFVKKTNLEEEIRMDKTVSSPMALQQLLSSNADLHSIESGKRGGEIDQQEIDENAKKKSWMNYQKRMKKKYWRFWKFLRQPLAKEVFSMSFVYIASLLRIEKLKLRIQVNRKKYAQLKKSFDTGIKNFSSQFLNRNVQARKHMEAQKRWRWTEGQDLRGQYKEDKEKLVREKIRSIQNLRRLSSSYCLILTKHRFKNTKREKAFYDILHFFVTRIIMSQIESRQIHPLIENEIMRLFRSKFYCPEDEMKEITKFESSEQLFRNRLRPNSSYIRRNAAARRNFVRSKQRKNKFMMSGRPSTAPAGLSPYALRAHNLDYSRRKRRKRLSRRHKKNFTQRGDRTRPIAKMKYCASRSPIVAMLFPPTPGRNVHLGANDYSEEGAGKTQKEPTRERFDSRVIGKKMLGRRRSRMGFSNKSGESEDSEEELDYTPLPSTLDQRRRRFGEADDDDDNDFLDDDDEEDEVFGAGSPPGQRVWSSPGSKRVKNSKNPKHGRVYSAPPGAKRMLFDGQEGIKNVKKKRLSKSRGGGGIQSSRRDRRRKEKEKILKMLGRGEVDLDFEMKPTVLVSIYKEHVEKREKEKMQKRGASNLFMSSY